MGKQGGERRHVFRMKYSAAAAGQPAFAIGTMFVAGCVVTALGNGEQYDRQRRVAFQPACQSGYRWSGA
jgi:hypothetical protein